MNRDEIRARAMTMHTFKAKEDVLALLDALDAAEARIEKLERHKGIVHSPTGTTTVTITETASEREESLRAALTEIAAWGESRTHTGGTAYSYVQMRERAREALAALPIESPASAD